MMDRIPINPDGLLLVAAIVFVAWLAAFYGAKLVRRMGMAAWALGTIEVLFAAGVFFVTGERFFETAWRNNPASIAAALLAALGVLWFSWLGVRAADRAGPMGQGTRRRAASVSRAPREGAPDVFISYRRDERAIVIDLARRLEALGLTVWFDAQLRSGTAFDAEIARNVRAARCVLVCWSPGAVASDWVRSEATIGRERNVLAAAMLMRCELPPPFNLVHTEDLTAGLDASPMAWARLVERIGALVGRSDLGGSPQRDSIPGGAGALG